MNKKVRAAVEEELRVLYTCPDIRRSKEESIAKENDFMSKLACTAVGHDVGDHFERATQLADPSVFGKAAPKVTQKQCKQALLQALYASSTKAAGFSHLAQHSTTATAELPAGLVGYKSPLVVLLRRVAMWYYYHVVNSPLDVLLSITADCELLFRLLTPHMQLETMTEIVTHLASPTLALQNDSEGKPGALLGKLDTPVHTATLLSMMKMAQQLAVAEAKQQQLQEQQQQQQPEQYGGSGCSTAPQHALGPFTALQPTALLQMRLARLVSQHQQQIGPQQQQQQQQQQDVWRSPVVQEAFGHLQGVCQWQQQGYCHVIVDQHLSALVCVSDAEIQRVLGALLSQLPHLTPPYSRLLQWASGSQQIYPLSSPVIRAWQCICEWLAPASSQSPAGASGKPADGGVRTRDRWCSAAVVQQAVEGTQLQQQMGTFESQLVGRDLVEVLLRLLQQQPDEILAQLQQAVAQLEQQQQGRQQQERQQQQQQQEGEQEQHQQHHDQQEQGTVEEDVNSNGTHVLQQQQQHAEEASTGKSPAAAAANHHQQQQHQQQQQQGGGRVVHPVELLRRLFDVLLQGIMFQHAVEANQLHMCGDLLKSQMQLLRSLHSRIITRFRIAEQQVAPTPLPQQDPTAASSSSSGGGAAVWQQCFREVQRLVVVFVSSRQAMMKDVAMWGVRLTLQHHQRDPIYVSRTSNFPPRWSPPVPEPPPPPSPPESPQAAAAAAASPAASPASTTMSSPGLTRGFLHLGAALSPRSSDRDQIRSRSSAAGNLGQVAAATAAVSAVQTPDQIHLYFQLLGQVAAATVACLDLIFDATSDAGDLGAAIAERQLCIPDLEHCIYPGLVDQLLFRADQRETQLLQCYDNMLVLCEPLSKLDEFWAVVLSDQVDSVVTLIVQARPDLTDQQEELVRKLLWVQTIPVVLGLLPGLLNQLQQQQDLGPEFLQRVQQIHEQALGLCHQTFQGGEEVVQLQQQQQHEDQQQQQQQHVEQGRSSPVVLDVGDPDDVAGTPAATAAVAAVQTPEQIHLYFQLLGQVAAATVACLDLIFDGTSDAGDLGAAIAERQLCIPDLEHCMYPGLVDQLLFRADQRETQLLQCYDNILSLCEPLSKLDEFWAVVLSDQVNSVVTLIVQARPDLTDQQEELVRKLLWVQTIPVVLGLLPGLLNQLQQQQDLGPEFLQRVQQIHEQALGLCHQMFQGGEEVVQLQQQQHEDQQQRDDQQQQHVEQGHSASVVLDVGDPVLDVGDPADVAGTSAAAAAGGGGGSSIDIVINDLDLESDVECDEDLLLRITGGMAGSADEDSESNAGGSSSSSTTTTISPGQHADVRHLEPLPLATTAAAAAAADGAGDSCGPASFFFCSRPVIPVAGGSRPVAGSSSSSRRRLRSHVRRRGPSTPGDDDAQQQHLGPLAAAAAAASSSTVIDHETQLEIADSDTEDFTRGYNTYNTYNSSNAQLPAAAAASAESNSGASRSALNHPGMQDVEQLIAGLCDDAAAAWVAQQVQQQRQQPPADLLPELQPLWQDVVELLCALQGGGPEDHHEWAVSSAGVRVLARLASALNIQHPAAAAGSSDQEADLPQGLQQLLLFEDVWARLEGLLTEQQVSAAAAAGPAVQQQQQSTNSNTQTVHQQRLGDQLLYVAMFIQHLYQRLCDKTSADWLTSPQGVLAVTALAATLDMDAAAGAAASDPAAAAADVLSKVRSEITADQLAEIFDLVHQICHVAPPDLVGSTTSAAPQSVISDDINQQQSEISLYQTQEQQTGESEVYGSLDRISDDELTEWQQQQQQQEEDGSVELTGWQQQQQREEGELSSDDHDHLNDAASEAASSSSTSADQGVYENLTLEQFAWQQQQQQQHGTVPTPTNPPSASAAASSSVRRQRRPRVVMSVSDLGRFRLTPEWLEQAAADAEDWLQFVGGLIDYKSSSDDFEHLFQIARALRSTAAKNDSSRPASPSSSSSSSSSSSNSSSSDAENVSELLHDVLVTGIIDDTRVTSVVFDAANKVYKESVQLIRNSASARKKVNTMMRGRVFQPLVDRLERLQQYGARLSRQAAIAAAGAKAPHIEQLELGVKMWLNVIDHHLESSLGLQQQQYPGSSSSSTVKRFRMHFNWSDQDLPDTPWAGEHFHDHFYDCVTAVQRMVRLHVWLSSEMQGLKAHLNHVSSVSDHLTSRTDTQKRQQQQQRHSGPLDAQLFALSTAMHAEVTAMRDAVRCIDAVLLLLSRRLKVEIIPAFWSVLQQAFNLMCSACKKRRGDDDPAGWSRVHRRVAHDLEILIALMLQYLANSTTQLPLPGGMSVKDFKRLCGSTHDQFWQMLLTHMRRQPGLTSLWFLLQKLSATAETEIEKRAAGDVKVVWQQQQQQQGDQAGSSSSRSSAETSYKFNRRGVHWDGYDPDSDDNIGHSFWDVLPRRDDITAQSKRCGGAVRTVLRGANALREYQRQSAADKTAPDMAQLEHLKLLEAWMSDAQRGCREELLRSPCMSDAESDTDSDDVCSEAFLSDYDDMYSSVLPDADRVALACHQQGAVPRPVSIRHNPKVARRFAVLSRQHKVAARLLALQDNLQQCSRVRDQNSQTAKQLAANRCSKAVGCCKDHQLLQPCILQVQLQNISGWPQVMPDDRIKSIPLCLLAQHGHVRVEATDHPQGWIDNTMAAVQGLAELQDRVVRLQELARVAWGPTAAAGGSGSSNSGSGGGSAGDPQTQDGMTAGAEIGSDSAAAHADLPTAVDRLLPDLLHSTNGSQDQQQQTLLNMLLPQQRQQRQQQQQQCDCTPTADQALLLGTAKLLNTAATVDSSSSSSYRGLLWSVLQQLKPSATNWYQHAVLQHWQPQPGSSKAAAAAGFSRPMHQQPISQLWQLVGNSIASDLLVTPPAFRDLLHNNWAGGAGRLLPDAAAGSSSSVGAAAARMLVVQYARAVRQKHAEASTPHMLISNLLLLHLLAHDSDKLAELQLAAAAVAAALTAAGAAAEMDGKPLFAAAVDLHRQQQQQQGCGSSHNTSSSSSRDVPLHLIATQYGYYTAAPQISLPWLQFCNMYHSLHSTLNPEVLDPIHIRGHSCGDAVLPGLTDPMMDLTVEPDRSLAAAAAVLKSYGVSLPSVVELLSSAADRACANRLPRAPLTWLPKAPAAAAAAANEPKWQQQQWQQDPLLACGYWLHADRLLDVPPAQWQQYVKLMSSSSDGSSSSSAQANLVADLCCDWCNKLLDSSSTSTSTTSSSSSKAKHWCPSCTLVQYCSADCAAAGQMVHQPNCWRIAALAAAGCCWQHMRAGDKHSRAFFCYPEAG